LGKAEAVAATASKECRLDHIVDDAIDARIDGPMKLAPIASKPSLRGSRSPVQRLP
jgi:hypothetical protein